MRSFRDINFKYTDAQSELAYAPELIRHAYVDIENATDQVLNTSRFIVYGPKGSGKTALAARLILASHDDAHLNVESDDLESFDFDLLREIDARDADGIGGSLAALKSMLMIRLFSTLGKDAVLLDTTPHCRRATSAHTGWFSTTAKHYWRGGRGCTPGCI